MENSIDENSESIKFEDFDLDENVIEKSLRHYINKNYFKVKIGWNNKLITDYNNIKEINTVTIVREILLNYNFVKKNCIINELIFNDDRNILNTNYFNLINKYDEDKRNFSFELVKNRIRELLTEDAVLIEYTPIQKNYNSNLLDDVDKENEKVIEPNVVIYDFEPTPKVKPKNILSSIFSGLITCSGISIATCALLGLIALSSLWSIILGAAAIFISTLALGCFIYNLIKINNIIHYLKNPKNNFEHTPSENEIDNSPEILRKPPTINRFKFFR